MAINMQSAALKEAIDDLEWPGSSIQVSLQPAPPVVTFRGEGNGDLQVEFLPLNEKEIKTYVARCLSSLPVLAHCFPCRLILCIMQILIC